MGGKGLGVVLMAGGAVALALGALSYAGLLGWLGRLPGDLRFESSNVRIYVPITSMLVVSVGVTLVVVAIRRFL